MSRLLELREAQREAGQSLALESGALKRCGDCDDVVDNDPGALQAAYMAGSSRFARGEYKDIFSTQRELTDAIKAAYDDAPWNCTCDVRREKD
jgi:hypothetical protein